jgi:hypothetical protein
MTPTLFAGARLLAASDSDDKGRGSPIGLFVVLILCVAVYFLWKSLNRHLRNLPESFDPPVPTEDEFTAAGVTTAGHKSAQTDSPGSQTDGPAARTDSPASQAARRSAQSAPSAEPARPTSLLKPPAKES